MSPSPPPGFVVVYKVTLTETLAASEDTGAEATASQSGATIDDTATLRYGGHWSPDGIQ